MDEIPLSSLGIALGILILIAGLNFAAAEDRCRVEQHRPAFGLGRVDFTETLFWQAGVRTDAHGEATVRFALSDSGTTFRASAGGCRRGGRCRRIGR